jgi:hypothetical protein
MQLDVRHEREPPPRRLEEEPAEQQGGADLQGQGGRREQGPQEEPCAQSGERIQEVADWSG